MFLNHFDVLMSKIIFFKKKIYYFDVFPSEKQPQSHSQTRFFHNMMWKDFLNHCVVFGWLFKIN